MLARVYLGFTGVIDVPEPMYWGREEIIPVMLDTGEVEDTVVSYSDPVLMNLRGKSEEFNVELVFIVDTIERQQLDGLLATKTKPFTYRVIEFFRGDNDSYTPLVKTNLLMEDYLNDPKPFVIVDNFGYVSQTLELVSDFWMIHRADRETGIDISIAGSIDHFLYHLESNDLIEMDDSTSDKQVFFIEQPDDGNDFFIEGFDEN